MKSTSDSENLAIQTCLSFIRYGQNWQTIMTSVHSVQSVRFKVGRYNTVGYSLASHRLQFDAIHLRVQTETFRLTRCGAYIFVLSHIYLLCFRRTRQTCIRLLHRVLQSLLVKCLNVAINDSLFFFSSGVSSLPQTGVSHDRCSGRFDFFDQFHFLISNRTRSN